MGRHRSTQLEDIAPLTVVGRDHNLGLQAQRQHTTSLFGTHTECDHILIKDFRRFAGIKPSAVRRIFCAFTFLVSVGHINIIWPNKAQLSAKLILRVVAVPRTLLRKARNAVPHQLIGHATIAREQHAQLRMLKHGLMPLLHQKAHQLLCRLTIRRDLILALVADPGHPLDLLQFLDATLRDISENFVLRFNDFHN